MKHFTIAYTDENNNFFEICEYAEKSDDAIKNAIKDIPFLNNHKDYIFRCTNESDLDWLTTNFSSPHKEINRKSLSKDFKEIIKSTKEYILHLFQWSLISLKDKK